MNAILFCGNHKAFDGILICVLSILKYYKKPLTVYVMTMDLQAVREDYKPICWQQARYLDSVLTSVCADSSAVLVDMTKEFYEEMSEGANFSTVYTPYALLRLYADKLPARELKRLLYLDADTVACGDIGPLFETDVAGYEFAAVRDYLGKWFIDYHYMNAGVLYFNMEKMRETGLFMRARRLCRDKKMWFPDQTALNKLVKNKLFLPGKYNEQRRYRKNTVIQHFCKSLRIFPYIHTVNIKPWEIDKLHEIYRLRVYDDILGEFRKHKEVYRCCNTE